MHLKTIEEIKNNPQVNYADHWGNGDNAYSGSLRLDGQIKQFYYIVSIDNGKWEHVSVSLANSNKSLPTWKDMCRIKDIFWHEDEEVHQIHPKAEQYVHGVSDLENVLHLWRPVGGWREFEE